MSNKIIDISCPACKNEQKAKPIDGGFAIGLGCGQTVALGAFVRKRKGEDGESGD